MYPEAKNGWLRNYMEAFNIAVLVNSPFALDRFFKHYSNMAKQLQRGLKL